jgi:hypothetical protein
MRLRIPRTKITYYFEISDVGDLTPLAGGRGQFIFFSPADYPVVPNRQLGHGVT